MKQALNDVVLGVQNELGGQGLLLPSSWACAVAVRYRHAAGGVCCFRLVYSSVSLLTFGTDVST